MHSDARWVGDESEALAGKGLAIGDIGDDASKEIVVGVPTPYGGVAGTPGFPMPHIYSVRGDSQGGRLSKTAQGGADQAGVYGNLGDGVVVLGPETQVLFSGILASNDEGYIVCPAYGDPITTNEDLFEPDAWLRYEMDGELSPTAEGYNCSDLNGDGIDELCMPTMAQAHSSTAALLAFPGPLEGEHDLTTATYKVVGPADDGFGRLGGSFDPDADGISELLISAFYENDRTGAVYIAEALPGTTMASDHPRLVGELPGDQVGTSFSSADLDGDGNEEAVIGAHIANDRTGRAYLVDEVADGELVDSYAVFEGRHKYDWLGYRSATGDFDGDGQPDLVIAAPRDVYFGYDRPGRVVVFLGPIQPGQYTEDDADARIITSEVPDNFGYRLAADDLDDDGRDDLVVGAPWAEVDSLPAAGAVHLLLGAGL